MLSLLRSLIRRVLRGRAPRPRGTRELGAAGERTAADFLRARGYRVLARNIELGPGEADLVCAAPDGTTLVIVEVKTRQLDPRILDPIRPEANIHGRKRATLRAIARAAAKRREWGGRPVRIDVVAVEWAAQGDHVIRHHVGAVR